MQLESKHSSGVSKAGLATGIVGTSLGAINALGNGMGLLGGLTGNNRGMCYGPISCDDEFVTRYDAKKDARIAELETQVALRDANTFTDQKFIELYKDSNARFNAIEKQLCMQEVQNQKVADSIQMVQERSQCCCDALAKEIQNEREARKCADNTIVNYVNATFYPKMVADVTTGTTTTAQTIYNPLPVSNSCGNCCK